MQSALDVSSPWKPLSVGELVEVMRGADFFWCLAAGHAIERVVGRACREHGDIDIVVRRSELPAVRRWLDGWRLHAADPPGQLRPWSDDERLPEHVHDVWCHRENSRAWELQLMLQDCDGPFWYYRRDRRVHGAIDDLATMVSGVPCLRTDLQLLYKSKEPREKDKADFRAALPLLTAQQRRTLAEWLQLTNPNGHPWLADLTD